MTTDPSAAAVFYERVLGFGATARTLLGGGVYTRLTTAQGRPVGGLYGMPPEAGRAALAAHWCPHALLADAPLGAATVRELGGRVIAGPFDLWGGARLVLVHDPAGAPFGLYEGDDAGDGIWAELTTGAPEEAASFYGALLGWSPGTAAGDEFRYRAFSLGERQVAALLAARSRFGRIPSHWLCFFPVVDPEATVATIAAAGGRILAPPTPNGHAVVADPQGAVFGIRREG